MLTDQEISELMESGPSAITASAWHALCDQAKAANVIVEELATIGDVLCGLTHYRKAPDSHPVMSWDDKPLTIGTLRKALALRGEAR